MLAQKLQNCLKPSRTWLLQSGSSAPQTDLIILVQNLDNDSSTQVLWFLIDFKLSLLLPANCTHIRNTIRAFYVYLLEYDWEYYNFSQGFAV